jgi:hypothetical protein
MSPPLFRNERPERSERLNAVRGTVKGKCQKMVSQYVRAVSVRYTDVTCSSVVVQRSCSFMKRSKSDSKERQSPTFPERLLVPIRKLVN